MDFRCQEISLCGVGTTRETVIISLGVGWQNSFITGSHETKFFFFFNDTSTCATSNFMVLMRRFSLVWRQKVDSFDVRKQIFSLLEVGMKKFRLLGRYICMKLGDRN